jgi:hypothetical protein
MLWRAVPAKFARKCVGNHELLFKFTHSAMIRRWVMERVSDSKKRSRESLSGRYRSSRYPGKLSRNTTNLHLPAAIFLKLFGRQTG